MPPLTLGRPRSGRRSFWGGKKSRGVNNFEGSAGNIAWAGRDGQLRMMLGDLADSKSKSHASLTKHFGGILEEKICCILNHHGCFKQFPVIYCHYLLFVYKKHIAMQSGILSLKCLPCSHGISSSACFAPPTNPGWSLFVSRRRSIQSELLLVRRWQSSLVPLTPSSSSYSPASPSQLQRARWPIPISLLHLRQIVRCLQVSNTTSGQEQSSVVFCPA